MSELLKIAELAARRGGAVVREYFENGVEIRKKGAYDLVSDADVEAEQAIVETIKGAFPEHSILAEETHKDDASAEHLWVIDPLDGTNNFAHHVPHFAISVAYYHDGQAQLGVIYNPIRDDWFIVQRGAGAFHNGKRVACGEQKQLGEVLVGVGFYYDRGAMMEATLSAIRELFHHDIHGIRRFGTASLDLCHVGCGAFGAFFEYELSPWDFAAGRLFVEEAGGRVTTCRGEDLPMTKTSLLASNGHLHETVLEIVRRHAP